MNNKVLLLMAIVIMVIGLFFMGINLLIFRMPDWAVRITGIVMLIDIAVYSFLRNKNKQVV